MNGLPPDHPEAADVRALLEDAPYIDDAGFSDRVVRAMPRRRRDRAVSYAIVPAFTALACALAFALGGHGATNGAHHAALSITMTSSFLAFALALVLVALATLLPADD